ncbi:MAG: hypothetical protein CSA75_04040 [Sorangium cellulosum]|nr:MAG: hypothetical protein CSA75_04040 [Sorangium cellulosum]
MQVGRFRTFVEQYDGAPEPGAGAHPFIEGSGWDSDWDNFIAPDSALLKEGLRCDPVYATWTESGGEYVNRPINCVTWYEAFAFCAWDGGRLPTEQEWEYVAAGGEFNQLYPWGSDAPTQSLASYDCLFDGTVGCNNADLPDVGSLPAGAARWNHLDMSGGVYEWTLDSFVPDWYSGEGSDCQNCANLIRGSQRVIRGGSFSHTTPRLRAASRDDAAPSDRTNFIGFRCARDFER